jgi:hypothetical protein
LPCAQFGLQFDALEMPVARATGPPQLDQRSFSITQEPSWNIRTSLGRTLATFCKSGEAPGTSSATSE